MQTLNSFLRTLSPLRLDSSFNPTTPLKLACALWESWAGTPYYSQLDGCVPSSIEIPCELDSYSFNPHKWLLTNFDCCALWTADAAPVKEALSLTPVFLQ
eukprot:scaffold238504_cov23-Tisochrysis_lutea.AAC.1